jgi:thiol-disulfide isomerase/thioredoxin
MTLFPLLTRLLSLLLLSTTLTLALPSWAAKPAPAMELPDAGGKMISLASLKGRWVMVNYWASWCTPCTTELPHLEALQKTHADKPFTIVAVNIDPDRASADAFLRKQPLALTVLFDTANRTTERFGITAMPTTFIIDPAGNIVWTHRGYEPGDEATYAAKVLELLNK